LGEARIITDQHPGLENNFVRFAYYASLIFLWSIF